jgi:hypothetical protein
MTTDFEVYDPSGNLLMNSSTRLSRYVGRMTIVADSTGSITVPGAANGKIWWQVYYPGTGYYSPLISASGTTLSWAPNPSFPGTHTDVVVLYGIF